MTRLMTLVTLATMLSLSGCNEPDPVGEGAGMNEAAQAQKAAPTNRVEIPAPVRRNLGITFAKVERRNVAATLRQPGRFELLPTARREHRAAAAGRVDLLVAQYQRVEVGTPLYRLDSPRWREVQEQISSSEAALAQSRARSESIAPLNAAHRQHEDRLREKAELWRLRLAQLEALREAGGGQQAALTEARTTLSDAQTDLAEAVEKGAELIARAREIEAELIATTARSRLQLDVAASLTGIPVEELLRVSGPEGQPTWRSLASLEFRARVPGIVEAIGITDGTMVEYSQLVLSTVQPELIRFRARALQSDLGRLRDGLPARVVPLQGGTLPLQDAMSGTLQIGLTADADERTVDLVVIPEEISQWARAGVSAHLEVTLAGGTEELAIPQSAVVRDGARGIIFRRDPADPDKVIRMEADLGLSDGRWVVIASGVKEGDEIVLGGNFQLMLATSGSTEKAGHFHSDGTFHEGSH